jgi:hypothetical protein
MRRRDPWSGVVTVLLVPGLSSTCNISQQLFTTGGRGGGTHGQGWSPSCWSLDCPRHVIFLNSCSLQGDEEEGPMVWVGHRPAGPWIILYMYYFSTVAHNRGRDPWSGMVTVLLVPGLSSICIISQQLLTTGGGTHGLGWSPSCWALDCPPYVLYLNSCSL